MPHRKWLFILLVLALLAASGMEVGVRCLVADSPHAYGTLHGIDLPLFKVVPSGVPPRRDPEAPVEKLAVNGAPITEGDLYGFIKDDPEIGYVREESRRSRNGWWQSNEIGARSRASTPKAIPPGRIRVAVFGGAYAAGTRLPQDETWTARLQEMRPELEVINFGVEDYATAQSYLLERRMRDRIDTNVSLFVFVPFHDPWKDVNVVRYLYEQWSTSAPMPRFVLEGEGIRLVPPFYPRESMVYERDFPEPSPELRAHLRSYDRLYVPALYDPSLLCRSVFGKIFIGRRERFTQKLARRAIGTDVEGEAFEVTRRILQRARDEGAASGRRVVVAVLPVERDLDVQPKLEKARDRWQRIITSLREREIETIDLAPALAAIPAAERDAAIDGTYYGPRMNRAIAQAIADTLR